MIKNRAAENPVESALALLTIEELRLLMQEIEVELSKPVPLKLVPGLCHLDARMNPFPSV
jgi:hypothetical protein